MRKISADYIFPIASEPIKNGIITLDKDDVIVEVSAGIQHPTSDIQHFEGIICPGFVNTHCHLELSHLKGKISEKKGIAGFVSELVPTRNQFTEEQILNAIEDAESEMIKNGIVAVGDISNTNHTFKQKAKENLLHHTFIEVFDLNPDKANEVFEKALKLKAELSIINSSLSIIPHAPYTVSDKLFELIKTDAEKNNSILSIHNQESEAENELFISKSGKLFELFTKMGINLDYIKTEGKNSLQSIFKKLPLSQKILLVHNTFTSKEDILFVKSKEKNQKSKVFWCTCPNANMYIENKLPDYNLFIKENLKITIGTDSLASNWSLSVLDELKTIAKHFPEISLQTLLTWATKNGAEFLGVNQLGTIEKGKKPGLNLLKNIDGLKINDKTEVVKLI